MTFRGQKSRSYFDVKYVKNGKNYDVGLMGFTLDDLERLKVKVTNGPVMAIGMRGYMPVQLTGLLVCISLTVLVISTILSAFFRFTPSACQF